jgi:hypothetical protein
MRLEHVVVVEGRRSVRTDSRALRHSSKAGTCDDRRMEWRVVLHLADIRFPVLGGDVAPEPTPFRQLGRQGTPVSARPWRACPGPLRAR